MPSSWNHRLKAEHGVCLWSQHSGNRAKRVDVNPRPTWLCGEILSQKPHQRNKNNDSTHCVLVNIVNRTGSGLTKETSVWANGGGVICIKLLDGNSHISCARHHSMRYERKLVHIVICGLDEGAAMSHEVHQSYRPKSPNCKVYCNVLKIVLPFMRKYRVKILLQ